jgi:hypothetical protein
MDLSILPECYVDTCLIETLVPPITHYNHQKGTGTVAKKMKQWFGDRFAVGVIDRDKRELHYLREFYSVSAKYNLELFKHNQKHHYLILIEPAIESFILRNAKEAGIRLENFDLPSSLDELRKISKSVESKKDPRFKALFRALIDQNQEEMVVLTAWISYFKNNNYDATLEALKLL